MKLEHKIVDFNDESLAPKKGIVEIIPINPKDHEISSWRSTKDPKTGVFYGIPERETVDGYPIFKRLTITGAQSFNLEHEEERKEYICWLHSPYLLGSKFLFGRPRLRVYDRILAAQKEIKKTDRMMEAVLIARKMLGTKLMDFARMLGISPEDNDSDVVLQLVLEKAKDNPDNFMSMFHHSNRAFLEVFHRAKSVGLIGFTPETGYTYKNQLPLGMTEMAVCSYFDKQRTFFVNLDIESKDRSKYAYTNIQPEKEEFVSDEPMNKKSEATEENLVTKHITEKQKGTRAKFEIPT